MVGNDLICDELGLWERRQCFC